MVWVDNKSLIDLDNKRIIVVNSFDKHYNWQKNCL